MVAVLPLDPETRANNASEAATELKYLRYLK